MGTAGSIDHKLHALAEALGAGAPPRASSVAPAIDRWLTDAAAVRFHLRPPANLPVILAVLGGTGTGKSTLVNRLLGAAVSAASFRRTFTAGAVAVTSDPAHVPARWLGLDPVPVASEELPARGRADSLLVVQARNPLLDRLTIVDTPDLDGDQPAHHAQADRAFRWAQAVLMLVSPEKYQMTELLPYYRLARRYAVPAVFVMNKCETPEMLEDYRRLLIDQNAIPPAAIDPDAPAAGDDDDDDAATAAPLFAIPRDDAGYEPPPAMNLAALRDSLAHLAPPSREQAERGAVRRVADHLSRLRDQILAPLRADRRAIDGAAASLRSLEAPPPGIDVNPLTQQLQRRLQQRSVLYLIGPGKVLDRIRQVPSMLVRLPRTTWDLVIHGRTDPGAGAAIAGEDRNVPDFHATLADQFRIIQSRIDDALRAAPATARWTEGDAYPTSKIDPDEAGKIADEELADLKHWLESRWNATPRDTRLLMKMLRYLPGGEKLTQWTEAAPYLLAVVVATHHAFFGHIDLMILGGYTLATWLTERLSNEVAARTRQANRTIAQRFTDLAHDQIRRTIAWLQNQAPTESEITRLERMADELSEMAAEDS